MVARWHIPRPRCPMHGRLVWRRGAACRLPWRRRRLLAYRQAGAACSTPLWTPRRSKPPPPALKAAQSMNGLEAVEDSGGIYRKKGHLNERAFSYSIRQEHRSRSHGSLANLKFAAPPEHTKRDWYYEGRVHSTETRRRIIAGGGSRHTSSTFSERQEALEVRIEDIVGKCSPDSDSKLSEIFAKIDVLEQQARSCNLEICNVPDKRNESLPTLIEKIGNVLKCPVRGSEVISIHRVPHAERDNPRPKKYYC
ncbi:hypothetical protein ACJJTC_001578 [Scirpophaga incertulas]